MKNQSVMVSPESARQIMGNNIIFMEEAAKIFPVRECDLDYYQSIPFNTALLYYCSEPDNEFVLIPGIDYRESKTRPLTILEMHQHFWKRLPNLFAPCPELDNPISSFTNNHTCWPRWYLLPKHVMDPERIDKFFKNVMEMGRGLGEPKAWDIEPSVVYIYAWLLFLLVRNEQIFPDIRFRTCDAYSPKFPAKACLTFKDRRIFIEKEPLNKGAGIVPSIKPNLK